MSTVNSFLLLVQASCALRTAFSWTVGFLGSILSTFPKVIRILACLSQFLILNFTSANQ